MKPPQCAHNARGNIIGENHPRAKFSDHEVWLMRELWMDGWSLRLVALKMGASKGYIGKVCRGELRAQSIARYSRALEPIREGVVLTCGSLATGFSDVCVDGRRYHTLDFI